MKKMDQKTSHNVLIDLLDQNTEPQVPKANLAGASKRILHKNIKQIENFLLKHKKTKQPVIKTNKKDKYMLKKEEYDIQEALKLYLDRAKEKTAEALKKQEQRDSQLKKEEVKKGRHARLKDFLAKCAYKKSKK